MSDKTALLIGATGLVGEQCLKELLESSHYVKVIAVVRKGLKTKHPKLQQLVVDFDRLDDSKEQMKADDVYCAIGTTIGKAGSKKAFRKVDFEYPYKLAQLALWNGAKKFILVSSIGANSSALVLYSKVKGELEDALKGLHYESLFIFRPSVLHGDRKEKRAAEAATVKVMNKLSFVFSGPLKRYRLMPVDLLAQKMVKLGSGKKKGVQIIENEEIFDL